MIKANQELKLTKKKEKRKKERGINLAVRNCSYKQHRLYYIDYSITYVSSILHIEGMSGVRHMLMSDNNTTRHTVTFNHFHFRKLEGFTCQCQFCVRCVCQLTGNLSQTRLASSGLRWQYEDPIPTAATPTQKHVQPHSSPCKLLQSSIITRTKQHSINTKIYTVGIYKLNEVVGIIPELKIISMMTEYKSNETNNEKREIGDDVKCIGNTYK